MAHAETSGWSDEKREAVEAGLEQARHGEFVPGPDLGRSAIAPAGAVRRFWKWHIMPKVMRRLS